MQIRPNAAGKNFRAAMASRRNHKIASGTRLKPRVRPASAKVWSNIPCDPAPLTTHTDDLAIPAKQRKHLLDLEPGDCRFPVGDPQEADFFFCGAKKESGLPYCKGHAMRAYQPPQPRSRKVQDKTVVRDRVPETV